MLPSFLPIIYLSILSVARTHTKKNKLFLLPICMSSLAIYISLLPTYLFMYLVADLIILLELKVLRGISRIYGVMGSQPREMVGFVDIVVLVDRVGVQQDSRNM